MAKSHQREKLSGVIVASVFVLWAWPASGEQRLDFIAVAPDQTYRDADEALCQFIEKNAHVQLNRASQPTSYRAAIRKLVDRTPRDGPFLARMTPYAYVAAEMLGAQFDILATYRSEATKERIYHAYFVVNRQGFAKQPSLGEVIDHLKSHRVKFIFHDRFSTSSYFLPSLFFRSQRVFAMEGSAKDLTGIDVARQGTSSSELVTAVARDPSVMAAVWDGTKKKFDEGSSESNPVGRDVYFVQLPTALPNDLLVAATWLDKTTKEAVRDAIRSMKGQSPSHIGIGDFAYWEDIDDVADAREALANLRHQAAAAPAPVVVNVEVAAGPSAATAELLLAARQAGSPAPSSCSKTTHLRTSTCDGR